MAVDKNKLESHENLLKLAGYFPLRVLMYTDPGFITDPNLQYPPTTADTIMVMNIYCGNILIIL